MIAYSILFVILFSLAQILGVDMEIAKNIGISLSTLFVLSTILQALCILLMIYTVKEYIDSVHATERSKEISRLEASLLDARNRLKVAEEEIKLLKEEISHGRKE
jgi:hypothetical protein